MPRKTLKQRQESNPTDDNDNRVRSVIDGVIGNEDPDDLMLEILNVLQESGRVPRAGKYYTFPFSPVRRGLTKIFYMYEYKKYMTTYM